MSIRLKYWLFKVLNTTFRLIIPAIAAGIIFGLFKEKPDVIQNPTWLQRAEIGVFVIILLTATEIKDFLGKIFKQFSLDKQVAFAKNNGVLFIVFATLLLMVKLYAERAIEFFYIAGISKIIAYMFEIQVNKYYRIINPSQAEMSNKKLDDLLYRIENMAANNE